MSRTVLLTTIVTVVVMGLGFVGYSVAERILGPSIESESQLNQSQLNSDMQMQIANLESSLHQLGSSDDRMTAELINSLNENMNSLANTIHELEKRLAKLENADFEEDQHLHDSSHAHDQFEHDQESAEQQQLEAAQYLASLDQHVIQEPDASFSGLVTEQIERTILEKPEWASNAQVSSMQCNATMCRFELQFAAALDDTTRFELEHTILGAIAEGLPGGKAQYQKAPDGSEQMIAYFARAGHQLPPAGLQTE